MPFDNHFGPPAWFMTIFFGIFGLIVFSFVIGFLKKWSDWNHNNASPHLSVDATIIAKRADVAGGKNSTSTSWHVTFELADGERREFEVKGHEYGLLAEGDLGRLDFQGARYLGFARSGSAALAEAAPVVPPRDLSCAYCQSAIPAGQLKCPNCGWTYRPETSSNES